MDPGEFSDVPFHGKIDKQIAWLLLEPLGITRDVFLQKVYAFYEHAFGLLLADSADQALYQTISQAKELVHRLQKIPEIRLGILSGNMPKIGAWKLSHGGYSGIFLFGVYGDEVDDRFQLAKSVYEKANAFFGDTFGPDNTIVIGDTAHDIACARHIGARVIAVTTGGHDRKTLEDAKTDLLVDSLMDEQVLALLGLKQ